MSDTKTANSSSDFGEIPENRLGGAYARRGLINMAGTEGSYRLAELNRSALIVTPKSPLLDWLHFIDPPSSHISLDIDALVSGYFYQIPEDTSDVVRSHSIDILDQLFTYY